MLIEYYKVYVRDSGTSILTQGRLEHLELKYVV